MTTQGPNQVVYISRTLPWRSASPLHKELGPRILRTQIIATAGQTISLFNAPYGPETIDKIIGVHVRAGGVGGAGNFVLADLQSNFSQEIQANTLLGNYGFNIETLPDIANIVFTPSIAILATMNLQVSLFNFEIQPHQMGHL